MVAKIAAENGGNAYPHKFHVSVSLPEFIEKYSSIPDGEHLQEVVTVAGSSSPVLAAFSPPQFLRALLFSPEMNESRFSWICYYGPSIS
jgi:hypothetical protein